MQLNLIIKLLAQFSIILISVNLTESRYRRSQSHYTSCRIEEARMEKSEELANTVFTGTVERIYRSKAYQYKGIVRVKRVLKGDQNLVDNSVIVEGFGSPQICFSEVKEKDTRIFAVNPSLNGRLKLNSSLVRVNINNLNKVIAAVKNLPFHAKSSINDKPCERMYCAYGAQCIVDEATKQAYCRCAERCNPELFAPVCGNDDITYSSVCQMNIRSCSEQKRIFIKHTGSCDMKDPCIGKECRFGAQCKPSIDGRNAECVCPTTCATYGDSRGSRPVCGTDGRDYPNVCELRRHSCKDMKEISVKFTGACDPCDGVECPASQICQLDDHRNPICRCNAVCNQDFKPVCGSDGKTYTNECILRVEACKARRSLRIIHSGICGESNPCATLQCTQFQECEIDRYGIATCQCPPLCPTILRPVCATDGHTYDSECDLQRQACLLHKDIHLKHAGNCGDEGPCSKGSNLCHFGAICVVKPNGEPACECPTCSEEFKPICGSDGISYPNECKMRRESCEQKKSIDISFTEGLCNGCENKNCEFYSVCESDGEGGKCICPQSCVHIDSPVCGSDGITYDNECEMRVSACKKSQFVTVATRGPCDVCQNVHCKYGARCENGRCVCPTECPDVFEPICGNDGVTYVNECEMRSAACRQSTDIVVKFYGECDEIVGSGSGSGGYTKVCDDKTCRYGGVCDYDENGVPHCLCTYHCPPSGHDSEPVCGSDGRLYDNECKLQEEACARQQEIKPQDMKMCEEIKILPCDGEPPLVNPLTRKEYFCGDGPDTKTCPPNSYCHKGNNFAKCCREVATVRSCAETTYGCCPDGKTAAQGTKNAGCPSVCGCNRLGSYSLTCDPTTKQCHCKPGVGGLRCDRCEAGFWGLHKISEGNSGCIPCACNEYGSVRDDCEQMTGRCVCKVGIQGMKCDVCPEGMILGTEGCTDASLTKTISGSCVDIKCHFGAQCKVREGRGVQCVCDLKCPNDEGRKAASVCGSDGNTYGSECQLRLFSCRYQKRITSRHDGQCKTGTSEAVTAGPVRRSTIFKTTQDTEKSTREVSLHENILLSTGPTVPTQTLPEVMQTPIETPAFDGISYMEMPRLQAYTRLSLEIEFRTLEDNGILIYNGQTLTGEGDFASLSIKDLHIEFRYNLGSGSVILRSTHPIQLGKVIKVVAKRYLWDGMLSVEGQEDVSGKSEGSLKSLDLAENLFLGFIPSKEKRIFENIGISKGLVGCILKFRIGRKDTDLRYPNSKDIIKASHLRECTDNPCSSIPCLNGATCLADPQNESYKCLCKTQYTGKQCETEINACTSNPCTDGATCIVLQELLPNGFMCKCPTGRTGKLCADLQREMFVVRVPDFWGSSFLQLPTLQGVSQAFTIEVWFLTRAIHGMILYNGQQASGKGDFLSLNINDGYVQFRYDLGSGIANVRSENPITLGEWHSIRITRKRKVGTLQLDDGPIMEGESKGSLSELNLEQPLYIGGVENMYGINRDSGIMIGLNGAIQRIVVNGEVWDNLVQRAIKHRNVPEYGGPPCGYESPCQNNGLCMPQLNDYICKCTVKYTGKKCDKLMEKEDTNKPVLFEGNTFLMFPNKITTVDDTHSTELGEMGVEGQRENRFEVSFKTQNPNGIILWLNKGATTNGDYLSLAISNGYLELSFNLGKQRDLLILKSLSRVDDDLWHTVLLHRNKRLGIMHIDNQSPISGTSEPGATELNTDGVLWIGGSPGLPTGLPTQYYQGFNGCISAVKVDGETLHLTTHSTASNLKFCSDL